MPNAAIKDEKKSNHVTNNPEGNNRLRNFFLRALNNPNFRVQQRQALGLFQVINTQSGENEGVLNRREISNNRRS